MREEILEGQCHCGKDGHPFVSINCPVHGCAHGKPRIAAAKDRQGNVFEAYELRTAAGQSIFIDVGLVKNIRGGIEAVRGGISPHFLIVMESLT